MWDPEHSNWTREGVTTTSPILGSAALDGQLHCTGHGVLALGFAGLCVPGLLDDNLNVSGGNASALLPLIPNAVLDELPFGVLVATVVISTSTALNVLTVRWARQARQRRLPIEERDPVWTPLLSHWASSTAAATARITRGALVLAATQTLNWMIALSSLGAFTQRRLRRRGITMAVRLAGRCVVQAQVCSMALLLGTFAAVTMLARVVARAAFSCWAVTVAARAIPIMGRLSVSIASGVISLLGRSVVVAYERIRRLVVTFAALGRLLKLVSLGLLTRIRSRNWRTYLQLRIPVIELPPTAKVAFFASSRLCGRLQSRVVDGIRRSTVAVLILHVASRLVGYASERWLGRQLITCGRAWTRFALYVRTGSPTPRLASFVVVGLCKRILARTWAALCSALSCIRSGCFSARTGFFTSAQWAKRLGVLAIAAVVSVHQAVRTVAVSARVSHLALTGCITRNAGRLYAILLRVAHALRHLGAAGVLMRFVTLLLGIRLVSYAVVLARRAALWVRSATVAPVLARFAAVRVCMRMVDHARVIGRWMHLRVRGTVSTLGLGAYVLASFVHRQIARAWSALQRTAGFLVFAVALRRMVAFVVASWLYRWTVDPVVR